MTRVVPIIFSAPMVRALLDGRKTMTRRLAYRRARDEEFPPILQKRNAPIWLKPTLWQKVKPGDLLYVREAWRPVHSGDPSRGAQYRADAEPDQTIWRPSIHLPRAASRLTLKVTVVKIERLQAISEEDADAEGIATIIRPHHRMNGYGLAGTSPEDASKSRVEAFRSLWRSLHGPASWDVNPEVVALTFEVIKRNVDDVLKEAA